MVVTNINNATFKGTVARELTFNHEAYNEKYYTFLLNVDRLSGSVDTLQVIASERVIPNDMKTGDIVGIKGQIRTMNKIVNEKSRLILRVFAQEFTEVQDINKVNIEGYICKPVNYRITPFEREIADVLIAVNRRNNKTDYIPCIVWGRNAKFASTLQVGTKLQLNGRLQSREYQKKISDTETKTMIAYEVSVSMLQIVDETKENGDGKGTD
jgi:hypothetical protein